MGNSDATTYPWRPPSLLDPRPSDPRVILGGATAVALAHIAVPLGFAALITLLHASGVLEQQDTPAPSRERKVVAARFVKLGKRFDPRKLPNRRVPRLSTAPPDSVAVSKRAVQRTQPDAGVRPPNPTEDLIQRLGDRAQVFAEIAQQREQEGDPDGIEEGTETTAQPGDLYIGKLYVLFRRGWTVPNTIGDEERSRLVADVDVSIGDDLRVRSARIRRSSGNPLFDQSVLDRIDALVRANTQLPEPPDEVAHEFVGQTLGLRFHGRHARSE